MLENIAQGKYSEAVGSYTALNLSSKIRGELIEKNDRNIKINIGNDKALEIELREDVSIEKGETVLIDRNNIARSQVINLDESIELESGEVDIYTDTLKKLDIDVNEENIKVAKQLDSYGIDVTEENFETYRLAKDSLDNISSSLDYESTIRLIEMDVDVENESVEKLASLVGELEEEKEGFNLLKLFKKKELTTEDAEEIAEKLYGNKMGKDIRDIIKSLHKREVNITKKNIEKINDVFYKLDNLKDVEDKTFINTIKNKLDINIDNLYKVKRYVKDEVISTEDVDMDESENNINMNNNRVINIKGYTMTETNSQKVTNRDLRLLEEDIEDLIMDLELELSDENIKLSKEFIKRDMDISKENITSVDEMKKALTLIIKNLDKETAAELIKENIDIEKTDIRVIAKEIESLKGLDEVEVSEMALSEDMNIDEDMNIEEDLYSKEIKELKQEVLKLVDDVEEEVIKIDLDETIKSGIKEEMYEEEIKNLKEEITKIVEKVKIEIEKTSLSETKNIELDNLKEELVKTIENIGNEEVENIESEEIKVDDIDINKERNTVLKEENIALDKKPVSEDRVLKKESYTKEIETLKSEIIKVIESDENEKIESNLLENLKNIKKLGLEKNEDLYTKGVKESDQKIINSLQNTETKDQTSIEELIKKVETLGMVEEKDLLTLLEKNVDFKMDKIEQVIFGKRSTPKIDTIEDATYDLSKNRQDITKATIDSIDKISTAFSSIGKLDFNTVAFQLKRNIPMTLMNIHKSSDLLRNSDTNNVQVEEVNTDEFKENNNNENIDESIDIKKALNRNGLESSRVNIKKTMEAYRSYNNVKQNLTSNMVKQSVNDNEQIENMDINLASRYVDEYRKSDFNNQRREEPLLNEKSNAETDHKQSAREFTDNAYEILKNSDENLMFLMKNKKPLSFKELKETHSMFKNEDQMGHKISELADLVDKDGDSETKKKFENLKKDIMNISKSMKGTKKDVEESYKQVEKSIKDIEENIKLLNHDENSLMNKKSKEVSEKIDEGKIIAKDNKIIQFPIYMNGQFTNLNMYFRDKERQGTKKDSEDISVVLSIDTVNMGNVNIGLDIKKKDINIKIGLENMDDRRHIESHKKDLVEFLEQDGYCVNEISFHNEDEIDILGTEKLPETKKSISTSNLDLIV